MSSDIDKRPDDLALKLEGSRVVFGMTKEAIKNGSVDKVVPLDDIPASIAKLLA